MRLVGLFSSSELDGSSRFTSAASVRPNASISSALAVSGGKCSRVPDATPSSVWHARQFGLLEHRIHRRGKRRSRRLRLDDRQRASQRQQRGDGGSKKQDPPYVIGRPGLVLRPGTQNLEPFVFIPYTPRALLSIPPSGSFGSGRVPQDTTVDACCCLNAATPALRHRRVADVEPLQLRQLRQRHQRAIADAGIRQIETGDALQRLESGRRRVVDAFGVPQAQPLKIRKAGQRLQRRRPVTTEPLRFR